MLLVSVDELKMTDNIAAEFSTISSSVQEGHGLNPGSRAHYERLQGLKDIKTTRDLTIPNLRDILRHSIGDSSLEVTWMGALEDMSGLNDAFNSTICRFKCRVLRRMNDKRGDVGDGNDKNVDMEEEEMSFVVKSPPRSSVIRLSHKFTRPFCNEVSWYVDLVQQLELANGSGCLGDTLPRCYHASSTYHTMETQGNARLSSSSSSAWLLCCAPCQPSEDGILIMENVQRRPGGKSYSMFEKHRPVPLNHVESIMRHLAKFHGLWLRYRYLNVSRNLNSLHPGANIMPWEEFIRRFSTQKRMPRLLCRQLCKVAGKTVQLVLANSDGYHEEASQKCRTFYNRTANRKMDEYLDRAPSTVIHTLCHGDFWSNNILFSYKVDSAEGEGAAVDDLILVDYQLLNYGHPCYDLVYFLYLNTDLQFRDAHLTDVLHIYWSEFNKYKMDIPDAPSELVNYDLDSFLADFSWFKPVGFVTACSVMPNVLSDTEVNLQGNLFCALRNLQRKQERELRDSSNSATLEIRRRIMDLVREMIRDGVL